MIGFDEAIAAVRSVAPERRPETLPLTEAVGRVAFERIRARSSLPTAVSAAMDGYACRAEDVADASSNRPGRLRLVDAARAGTPADRAVGAGEAIAIATGAVVPEGADALVVIEDARVDGDDLFVFAPARAKHVRAVGEDLEKGVSVVESGSLLGPRVIALIASAGHDHVTVVRAPSAFVLATGPELRSPIDRLGPGEVPDANAPLVASMLQTHGVGVSLGPPVLDDEASLESALEAGLTKGAQGTRPDVIVTTGGASVGRHDVVRRLLLSHGDVVFDGVRVRPGRPALLGRWHGIPWLALPGTPHAVAVLGSLMLRAWVDAAAGGSDEDVSIGRTRAILGAPLRSVPSRTVLQLARRTVNADGVVQVVPLERSPASRMRDVARSNALVVVPEGCDLAAGDLVETIDFSDGCAPNGVSLR